MSCLRADHSRLGTELLPLASLNTVTLLGAETVGRAYGGGMLKLEPREADLLPVPSPSLVMAARAELQGVRAKVQDRLRAGRLLEAAGVVDDVLLPGRLGLLVSTKGQLSAFAKNLPNRFEEAYGDAGNLRSRYPLAAVGFLFVQRATVLVREPESFGGQWT